MSTEKVTACCECTPVGETQFGEEDGRSASEAVVETIAAVEDVAPNELDPLHNTIDPESLDRLFRDTETSTSTKLVQFSVDGWNVFVRNDGAIRVCDTDRHSERAPAFQKPLDE
jgi:hypothetical protein